MKTFKKLFGINSLRESNLRRFYFDDIYVIIIL